MPDIFLNPDVRTLILVLFAGNLAFAVLVAAFHYSTDAGRDRAGNRYLFLSKAFLAAGFFLMLLRGAAPTLVSVNAGNTFCLIGFHFEAAVILRILNERRLVRAYQTPLSILAFLLFNAAELILPNPSIRVAAASVCIILILALPCVRLFVSPNSGKFKRLVGAMHLLVLMMLVPRAVHALTSEMSLFAGGYVQILTFMTMVLQLIFGLPAYLLLIKEESDKIIANMAATDMLTGLANRYAFIDAAQRVFHRTCFKGGTLSVLFIDIDFFKKVNDTHGHGFGDKVLAALGKSVNGCLRPTDLSCRYGGEEFVILLHDADAASALTVAERIRMAAAALSFPEKPGFSLTLSIGTVSGSPAKADDLDLFIERADCALYAAKHTGRDKVVEYEFITEGDPGIGERFSTRRIFKFKQHQ